MKQISTLLFASLFFHLSFSQNCQPSPLEDSVFLVYQTFCYTYDAAGDSFLATNVSRWTYEYQFVYDGYKTLTAVLASTGNTTQTYTEQTRVKFEYDSLGRETWQLVLNWNGLTYDSVSLSTRSYASQGRGSSVVFTDKRWFSGFGQPVSRSLDTFNVNGDLSIGISQEWDQTNMSWFNTFRKQNTYTPQGRLSSEEMDRWDSSSLSWTPYTRSTYTYDNTGFLTEAMTGTWNSGLNQFDFTKRLTYTATPTEKIASALDQNFAQGTWNNFLFTEYEYDNCDHEISRKQNIWVDSTSSWKLTNETKNTYNSSGFLVEWFTFGFNQNSQNLDINSGIRCINVLNNVTSVELPLTEDERFFQPNPLSNLDNIRLELEPDESYQLKIIDLQGRSLFQDNPRGRYERSLVGIPSGIYVLVLLDQDRMIFRQKLLIQ